MLTEHFIHKAGRIDQAVRDYFKNNSSVQEIRAKDLMELFVEKEIFNKDYERPGLPIREFLRELDRENKLSLFRHCEVIRHAKNRSWHFKR